jgi:hypothetical protein
MIEAQYEYRGYRMGIVSSNNNMRKKTENARLTAEKGRGESKNNLKRDV